MYRDHRVAVVMPLHNEEGQIECAIKRIPVFVDLIVAVDDASTDSSLEALSRITDERLRVFAHKRNRGVGAATKTGYRHALSAGVDLIAVMDGDGQMDGRDLSRLLDCAIAGADYVKGNRFLDRRTIGRMPRLRYIGNRFFSSLTRRAARFDANSNAGLDAHCGYTVIRTTALERLLLDELYDRYGFPTEMLFAALRAGFRVRCVPVRTVYGDEVSGINPVKVVPAILYLIVRGYLRRRFIARNLNNSHKPALLILTSSFPSSPDDATCGYIRDFARSMSEKFDVRVLAPPDKCSSDWPADVFTLTRSASMLADEFQSSRDLNQLAKASLLAKLRALPSVLLFFCRALAMSLRADVICSHWLAPSGLVGSIASRFLRKPHIAVEHSGAIHFLARSRVGRSIARFIIRGSDRVIVVSDGLKAKLLNICPDAGKKVEIIPMGIMTECALSQLHCTEQSPATCRGVPPWPPLLARPVRLPVRGGHGGPPVQVRPGAASTVLFVGRLVEIKGVDLLLTALNGMRDVRLVVAGDGEMRWELEQLANKLSVAATFAGRVGARRREELFATCDVVVIPSRVLDDGRTEGTPVVCLEAMLAGRVVVAARTGGLADIILDGQNGLLFDPGDHLMLRQRLLLALGDEELRKRVAANARLTADAFDWSRIGERFSNIIQNAIEENGHPRDSRIPARDLCR